MNALSASESFSSGMVNSAESAMRRILTAAFVRASKVASNVRPSFAVSVRRIGCAGFGEAPVLAGGVDGGGFWRYPSDASDAKPRDSAAELRLGGSALGAPALFSLACLAQAESSVSKIGIAGIIHRAFMARQGKGLAQCYL